MHTNSSPVSSMKIILIEGKHNFYVKCITSVSSYSSLFMAVRAAVHPTGLLAIEMDAPHLSRMYILEEG